VSLIATYALGTQAATSGRSTYQQDRGVIDEFHDTADVAL
jgi:hypothetical protein